MPKKKQGKLTLNNVPLHRHEHRIVLHYLNQGYDIELIPKSNLPGVRTADFIMFDLQWEMKSPKGCDKWLIKNTLQSASHQSENIIVDLRRIKLDQNRCLAELEKHFKLIKRIKHLKIITKTEKDIDMIK